MTSDVARPPQPYAQRAPPRTRRPAALWPTGHGSTVVSTGQTAGLKMEVWISPGFQEKLFCSASLQHNQHTIKKTSN
jgi:hypothetical protein